LNAVYLNLNFSAWRRHILPSHASWLDKGRTAMLGGVNSLMGALSPDASALLREDPVFLIGHWRSGTTYLHELLSLDARHTAPNTYECLYPHHFQMTQAQFMRSKAAQAGPVKRPMDQVTVSMQSPQEDEFALLCLGALSPYAWMLRPGEHDAAMDALDTRRWSDRDKAHWLTTFQRFLGGVCSQRPGRLVLKSPTHTFRVALLAERFPKAQFIHIVRHPDNVFPSTVAMWQSMFELYALEPIPSVPVLAEQVMRMGALMEDLLDEDIPQLEAHRHIRVRYEDLARAPLETVGGIYAHFRWPDWEAARPLLQRHIEERAGYTANARTPDEAQRARLGIAWKKMYDKYGYA
jgi:hypothetical protein